MVLKNAGGECIRLRCEYRSTIRPLKIISFGVKRCLAKSSKAGWTTKQIPYLGDDAPFYDHSLHYFAIKKLEGFIKPQMTSKEGTVIV